MRPKCSLENCNALARYVCKRKDGSKCYGKLCSYHHKKKYNMVNGAYGLKASKFKNTKCEKCGYEGICDRHRIKSGEQGGKYEEGNVLILCPNCHREWHYKNKTGLFK